MIDLLQNANWDIFRAINGHPAAILDPLMVFAATDLIGLLPLLLLATWIVLARWRAAPAGDTGRPIARWRSLGQEMVLLAGLAPFLALVLAWALGHLVVEPRPFVTHPLVDRLLVSHAADNSFPSDHEAVAAAVATVVASFAAIAAMDWLRGPESTPARRAGSVPPAVVGLLAVGAVAAVAIAGLIGLARVYVGVHYPLDIAGGALCGLAAGLLVVGAGGRLRRVLSLVVRVAERLRLA